MNRRNFLRLGVGAAAVIAAPAVVARANIMAVRPLTNANGIRELLFGEIDRFTFVQSSMLADLLVGVDLGEKRDHTAVASYERKGGTLYLRDLRIIESALPQGVA